MDGPPPDRTPDRPTARPTERAPGRDSDAEPGIDDDDPAAEARINDRDPRGSVTAAIAEVYLQVTAPAWAAPNLDALTDVLRDLSWLAPGAVPIVLDATTPSAVLDIVLAASARTAGAQRPIIVVRVG